MRPRNTAPIDGSNEVAPWSLLEFEYNPTSGAAVAALYQIGEGRKLNSPVYQKGVDGLGNHLAFPDLRVGRTYYWRVKVKTAIGQWTTYSEPTFFTVTAEEPSFSLFRDGYKNYEGARDVDIRGNGEDHGTAIRGWNQGNQDVLRIGRRGADMPTDEVYRSLLRFNICILKDAGAVLFAYLILAGWEHD